MIQAFLHSPNFVNISRRNCVGICVRNLINVVKCVFEPGRYRCKHYANHPGSGNVC